MIFNQHLDKLLELDIVRNFMASRNLVAARCQEVDGISSLLLYRDSFVVEILDAMRENYLQIFMVDLESDRVLEGRMAIGCSLDLGFQSLEQLRNETIKVQTWERIFLTFEIEKMNCLHEHLTAFDSLFPLIESEGLRRLQNSGAKYATDFPISIAAMYPGLRARYAKCLPQR